MSLNLGRPVPRAAGGEHRRPPVQIGSHFHFAEVNEALAFDRCRAARGHRLDIAPGTRRPVEPGIAPRWTWCPWPGRGSCPACGDWWPVRSTAATSPAGGSTGSAGRGGGASFSCRAPTTGPSPVRPPATGSGWPTPIRWIEVEVDALRRRRRAVFGGGKVIRESMGQSTRTRADGAPDLVIDRAVILDHWGVHKADIGSAERQDRRHRPGRQPRHQRRGGPALVIGPSTEILAGNGRTVQLHPRRHRLPRRPDLPRVAHRGPRLRHHHHHRRRHRPAEDTRPPPSPRTVVPGADARGPRPLGAQRGPHGQGQHGVRGVAVGAAPRRLVVQAPRGLGNDRPSSTPASGWPTRPVCRWRSTPSTLDESGSWATLAAIAGRTIHTFHTEGAGGGHAPDIITVPPTRM